MNIAKKLVLIILGLSLCSSLQAAGKIKFNFKNKDLVDVIEAYSKASKTSFVMTSKTDLKVSIFNSQKVSQDEALAQLARALKQDGLSLVKMGDSMNVVKARHATRDNIPVYKKMPQRMYDHMATLVVAPAKDKALKIVKEFRILSSKDGEIQAFDNKLYITDFYSNLLRVEKLINEVEE